MINILPVPQPGEKIDWDALYNSELKPEFDRMRRTMQNSDWHGEGDVWTHTQMVCQALVEMESWANQSADIREILFVAALLHDIGKPACTHIEDGKIVSSNHTRVGAKIARQILWRRFDLAGSKPAQDFREAVCSLIRFHSVPPHILDSDNPVYSVVRTSAEGFTVPKFTNQALAILVEADMRGRIADTIENSVETVRLFAQTAEENGCLNNPFPFVSNYSRFKYFHDKLDYPGINLYDNTWGTIVILSGLPGTGKDAYIKARLSNLPVISLDAIREEASVGATENQGAVINAARARAKEYLRNKTPFVWNATNVTAFVRNPIIQLCCDYSASVKIVYLETSWSEQIRRNASRENSVPESVLESLLEKMEIPVCREAHDVEWSGGAF